MITNDILDKIKESNSIAITFHTSPDGDSLGSALGLLQGIRKLNKKLIYFLKNLCQKLLNICPVVKKSQGR